MGVLLFLGLTIIQHFVDKPSIVCYNEVATQLHKQPSFAEKHLVKVRFPFFRFANGNVIV